MPDADVNHRSRDAPSPDARSVLAQSNEPQSRKPERQLAAQHDALIASLAERLAANELAAADVAEDLGIEADLTQAQRLLETTQPRARGPHVRLLIHADGRTIDFNDAAVQRFGLRAQGDRLAFYDDRLRRPDATTLFLNLEDTEGRSVLVHAIRQPDGRSWRLTEVTSPASSRLRDAAIACWRFTPSEADVAEALLEGQSSERIATTTGRTVNTVRQMVKQVLTKAAVHSQPQLVGRLAAMAATLAQVDETERPQPRLATLHTGDGTLGYWRYGEPGSTSVLFFHGALYGVTGRPDAAREARDFGFDVIAPMRPGYGEQALPEGVDPVALAVDQATVLLDNLGLERVRLLAHDVGTAFALAFAARRPERVDGIVCAPATPPMLGWSQTADMPPMHRVSAFAAQKVPSLMEALIGLGLRRIAREGLTAIPRLVFADSDHDREVLESSTARATLEHLYSYALDQDTRGFLADMFVTNRNWSSLLPGIRCPVTLLHGAQSRTVSRTGLDAMTRALPNAQLLIIPDAGHTLPLTHPTLALRHLLMLASAQDSARQRP